MSAVLLDSDVLVHLLTAGDPLQATARNALRVLRRQQFRFATTAQNVAEFWNVCTRPPSARNGLGFEPADVAKRLTTINRMAEVLTENQTSYAIWQRLVASLSIRGASVHDARLAAVMIAKNVSRILTFNGADFVRYQAEGIEVISPDAAP
jgi:predicted nucleic acid-binding protein